MANLEDAAPPIVVVVLQVEQQPEVLVEEEPAAAYKHGVEYLILLMGFCLSSALVIALQIQNVPLLPFHLLSLSILLGFATLLVTKSISSASILTAKVLHLFGVCFVVVTFYVAVAIPLPAFFRTAAWTVFLISVLALSGSTFL